MNEGFKPRKTLVESIVAGSPDALAKALNEFGEDHDVFATQTHCNFESSSYVAFVYCKVKQE